MGHGVTYQEALSMFDNHIHQKVDERDAVECSEKVLCAILKRHKDISKLGSAGLIDPAHAMKATKEMRDAVFSKVDCYVKNLHAMGLTKEWKSYKNIPAECIYNMDKAGMDTTKHRSKVLCNANTTIQKYCQTKEGDGKMNMHITYPLPCLTTRANGTFDRQRLIVA
jgi:hypothetical protein